MIATANDTLRLSVAECLTKNYAAAQSFQRQMRHRDMRQECQEAFEVSGYKYGTLNEAMNSPE